MNFIPESIEDIHKVFLYGIYDMDRMEMSDYEKKGKIQELKEQVILYITSRTNLTRQDQEIARKVIEGNYTLKRSFLTEASVRDPKRGPLTNRSDRINAIEHQARLRVERMGLLLKVINEWNSLSPDQQQREISSFSTSLNQGQNDTTPEEGYEEARRYPLQDITNTLNRGGFKYTSRNKKKKQKKSKKITKKSKKRSKKSKQKRKKKKTRTN